MDLCQLQLPLQQQVEQYMIAVLAVADMWMEEMGAVDILLLVKWQMEQATGLEVLSMGVWCQGELQ
jgi:hypothetical protein